MANTTKTFLHLINEYKIKIPLIQRDYAQGRENEENKAIKFLEAIKVGCEEKLNLDFVYGQINDTDKFEFIPLDGQQRLTTLFLLHWYLSLENQYLKVLNNFTYEVRSSSTDFIKALTEEKHWALYKKNNIKQQIENSNWFFLSWKNDPTVVSILNMLNLIEKYFSNKKIDQLNNITFEVLYLDEFNLTDELYVKMNARGKPLTIFENFKAEFERYIDYSDDDSEKVAKSKAKLDNEWLHIFWDLAKKEVHKIEDAPKLADKMFYNFFYNITLNLYLEKYTSLFCKDKVYKVISDKNSENGFVQNCTIFDFYKSIYKNEINVKELILLLDNLKVDDTFKDFVKDIDISQWERARFYALSLGYIKNLDKIEFDRWKRVSFNLINNQLIQSTDDLMKTIKSLKLLMEQSNQDVYNHIKNKPENIDYFSKIQRDEESLKASLILENNVWEQTLNHQGAEKNWYLDGQVGFLLDFADNDLGKFIIYRDKFQALWNFAKNEDTNKEKNNQILIYQALLTKGNYLPPLSSNNTFCSFDATSVRARNDNWRKVFNSDKLRATEDNPNRKQYLQDLLDDSNFDINDVEASLNNIIGNSVVNDFRKYFIDNMSYIEYCKKLQLRYIDENQIYLLKTTQMNGMHAELRTWDLFSHEFKLLEKSKRKVEWRLESEKNYEPFQTIWYYESISWNLPCIVFDDFRYEDRNIQLTIGYKDNSYYIFIYDEEKESLNNNLVKVLEAFGFDDTNTKSGISHNDILVEVGTICNELHKLV